MPAAGASAATAAKLNALILGVLGLTAWLTTSLLLASVFCGADSLFEGVASVEVSCVVETFSAFVEFWGEFTDDTVLVSLEVVSLLVWFTNSSAFVLLDWVVAGVLAWFVVVVVASPVTGVSSVVAFVDDDCVVSCCAGFCATLVSPLLVFDDVLVDKVRIIV